MDNPLTIVSQAQNYQAQNNETAYGPIADSYAQKYGIPTDVFRDAIRKRSGFDPQYSDSAGRKGIAGLSFTKSDSPNPNDVGSSFDAVGSIMSAMNADNNDWSKTLASFLGTDQATKDEQQAAQDEAAKNGDDTIVGRAINSITGFFKQSAFTILIVLIGLVLVLGSAWMIISNKGK
jgi:hypothetical protein